MASKDITVLETAAASSLNANHTFSFPQLKRRKISHETEIGNTKCDLGSTFTILPHDESSTKPQTLTSIAVLPRSRLPLSWLDLCPGTQRSIPSGMLFASNISILETRLQCKRERVVLVARLQPRKSATTNSRALARGDASQDELYVIERVKAGLYTIYGLVQSVGEGDVVVTAKSWKPDLENDTILDPNPAVIYENWLSNAEIPGSLNLEQAYTRTTDGVVFVFGQQSERGHHNSSNTGNVASLEDTTTVELASLYEAMQPVVDTPTSKRKAEGMLARANAEALINFAADLQNPRVLLEGLRTQYLEALYTSKTSVAYFAKGPLSRARTAFQCPGNSSARRISDLCYFYRESIVPIKKVDVKYRDSIPEVVRTLAPDRLDCLAPCTSGENKGKSKKRKIGKDGLYPEEKDMILKWWARRSVTETPLVDRSADTELKQLVAELRFRETQLQILLILETMSIETLLNADDESQNPPPSKCSKKKKQDLGIILELLVDRLCIWHTVGSDEPSTFDSSKRRDDGQPLNKAENDKLRDFCAEVIIPFYAPRLPEQCKAISLKLGGPISVSPKRPTTLLQKSTVENSTTTVKRQDPRKSRRTLQRVLTDEKAAAKRRIPSLVRHKSTKGIPDIKRESSEPVCLSLISSGRGAIQKRKRQDNREIDLDAVAKTHETKLKKVNMFLEQKKELDAAISALRKPNREQAGRDWADSAAKRSSTGSSRKQKEPRRYPSGEGVQVMVTPRTVRKKDCGMVRVSSLLQKWDKSNNKGPPSISDTEDPVVPSSISRPQMGSSGPKNVSVSVQETPLKPTAQISNLHRHSNTAGQSSFLSAASIDTPLKDSKRPSLSGTNPLATTFATPTKPLNSGSIGDYKIPNSDGIEHSPGIKETPLRSLSWQPSAPTTSKSQNDLSRPPANSVVFSTPVRKASSTLNRISPVVQGKVGSQPKLENSIYNELGWDEDEDDELAVPWSTLK
ncbi:hypothetical protein LOZ53_000843 [Ophidiomyces ophidiicola]|nr:hypothetical protein LOZ55_003593 [Ophidiomyces ophidiicola]KAI1985902.1 hypothetical protein LOZ51_006251 [Ophidiomyces ophidiicola]KAI1986295.1 hypothetical protein LOZ54_003925 [Ophidiomyces ophidiicola]KAI1997113.1 hypothetical protein LOZ53_000843 [Ophidiomyces ophidiicola]